MRINRSLTLAIALLLALVAARPAAAGPGDPADEAERIKRHEEALLKLATTNVTIEVSEEPLVKVLAQLQRDTGIPFMLDPAVRDGGFGLLDVSLNYENGSLEDILNDACSPYELGLAWDDGVFVVTWSSVAEMSGFAVAVIDVSRLLYSYPRSPETTFDPSPHAHLGRNGLRIPRDDGYRDDSADEDSYWEVTTGDTLVTLVQDTIARDTWDDPNSIDFRQGCLIVRHRPEVIAAVRTLLTDLQRFADRRVELELRQYHAPLGTGAALTPQAIVPAAAREALFAQLEARATLAHLFRVSLMSGERVGARDMAVTDEVSGRHALVAEGAVANEPVVTQRESGAQAGFEAAIDSATNSCFVEVRVGGVHTPVVREVKAGGEKGDACSLSLTDDTIWKIRTSSAIPDGATLVQWVGDAETGIEHIATLSVAIRSDVPTYPAPEPLPRDTAVNAALDKPITVDLDRVTPVRCAQEIAKAAGVELTVDDSAYDYEHTVSVTADGIPARKVLELAKRAWDGMWWTVRAGTLWVGGREAYDALDCADLRFYELDAVTFRARHFQKTRSVPRARDGSDEPLSEAREFDPLDSDTVVEVVESTIGGDRWREDFSILFHSGLLCTVATPEIHAKIAEILKTLRPPPVVETTVEAVTLTAAAYARLFPAGTPRRSPALTSAELDAIRADKPTPGGSMRITSFSHQRVYGLSVRRHPYVVGLQADVSSGAVGWNPEIGSVRGGLNLSLHAVAGADGKIAVRVNGALTRITRHGSSSRTADGVERPETHERAVDIREVVKPGETIAAVVGGGAQPIVVLVTPRIVGEGE